MFSRVKIYENMASKKETTIEQRKITVQMHNETKKKYS